MKEILWDGITTAETLSDSGARDRHSVADKAKNCDWDGLLAILTREPHLLNTTRPGGDALYTPLHHAAYAGAPEKVVRSLLRRGAFRTLREAKGNRPVDIAVHRSHRHLVPLLEPRLRHQVGFEALLAIQRSFHAVIRGRAADLVTEQRLRLPELEVLLEFESAKFWFPVPGMYGGFAFWLAGQEPETTVVVESWCRVAEGSGQRHEITERGSRLVDEGFV